MDKGSFPWRVSFVPLGELRTGIPTKEILVARRPDAPKHWFNGFIQASHSLVPGLDDREELLAARRADVHVRLRGQDRSAPGALHEGEAEYLHGHHPNPLRCGFEALREQGYKLVGDVAAELGDAATGELALASRDQPPGRRRRFWRAVSSLHGFAGAVPGASQRSVDVDELRGFASGARSGSIRFVTNCRCPFSTSTRCGLR